MNLEEKILQFLQEAKEPKSYKEIEQTLLGYSLVSVKTALTKLVDEQKVLKIGTTRNIYYSIDKKTTWEDVSNMYNEIAKETVMTKDNYADLREDIEKIDTNVNGIYANIISIMSIFVAIFALITVNANIVFKLTQENMCQVFLGVILVNIFVVICIIALLAGIRLIIINPLLGKRNGNKEKQKRG